MRHAAALCLALVPVTGLRKSARKVQSSWDSPALMAATDADADGIWTAMAPPSLFSASNLSFVAPGSKETIFQLEFEATVGAAGENAVKGLRGTDGHAQMTAVLQTDKTIAGSIVDPIEGMVHQFMGQEGGELTFTSIPSNKFPEEGEPLGEDMPENLTVSVDELGIQAASTIDVLVVWTLDAECANARKSTGCSVNSDTQSKMRAKINLAIKETNDAYAYSNINARLRLAHAYRHRSYVQEGFHKDLSNLGNDRIDGVFGKRRNHKADVVALIIQDPALCGLANLGPGRSRMFSVTGQSCATGYYSFGHEIAHNFGCRHDRGADRACSSSRSHYGFRDPEGIWRTTMGYACKSTDCLAQPVRGRCTRMKFYSNPNVKYNGKAIGWRGKADNARQINSVAATVAAYY